MLRVLLVEDDPLICDLVEDSLRDRGLDVATAHTGREACARIEAEPRLFAVLVTDINLGDQVNGFQVAKHARDLNPTLKVVYMTGLPSNIYSAEAQALMFPKPFDVGELADQVEILLAQTRG